MQVIGNNRWVITFLIFATTASIFTMDEPPQPKKKKTTQRIARWAHTIGEIILRNEPPQELTTVLSSFPFTQLPGDMQHYIISLVTTIPTAQNLVTVANAINALAQTTRELNQLFNETEFSFQLIKSLSHTFNIDNETACRYIHTKGTKSILSRQLALKKLCTDPTTTLKDFIDLRLQGRTDLNFTYKNGGTLLIFCIYANDLRILEYVLKKGANPNLCALGGTTPLIESITLSNNHAAQFLLAAGADPELPDSTGITPCFVAGEKGNERMMRLLDSYIRKNKKK